MEMHRTARRQTKPTQSPSSGECVSTVDYQSPENRKDLFDVRQDLFANNLAYTAPLQPFRLLLNCSSRFLRYKHCRQRKGSCFSITLNVRVWTWGFFGCFFFTVVAPSWVIWLFLLVIHYNRFVVTKRWQRSQTVPEWIRLTAEWRTLLW